MTVCFYGAAPIRSKCAQLAWVVVVLTGTSLPAHAEPTASVNPLQPEQSFQFNNIEHQRTAKPAVHAPQLVRPQTKADPTPFMTLATVTVIGARAISQPAITACYKPYIGKKVSQADLVKITEQISQLYRDAGYHLSRAIVPPQDIEHGHITIRMIQGNISEIVVKGDRAEEFGAQALLAPLTAENPSRFATLARQLLLVNDRAGMRIIDSTLEEIGETTGKFRLIVTVQAWRLFISTGLDNLGSAAVGPLGIYLTAALNSYFLTGDLLMLTGSTAPNQPDELAFGRAAYDAPIGTDGYRIGGTVWYSSIWPGDIRRLFDTSIDSIAFELRGSIAAVETQKFTLRLTLAAGAGEFIERNIFGTVYNDHVRTLDAIADATFSDMFSGRDFLTVLFRQGLPMFGASPIDDRFASHFGASGLFSIADFAFTRYQNLNDAWSIKLAAAGQLASAPLFLSQQFYLGGFAFGRGYDAGIIGGDNGIAGTAELRYDESVTTFKPLTGYQVYAFVDSGAVWDHYDDEGVLSLISVGVGTRWYFEEGLQAGIAAAFPVSYRVVPFQNQGPRILFSFSEALKVCPDQPNTRCF